MISFVFSRDPFIALTTEELIVKPNYAPQVDFKGKLSSDGGIIMTSQFGNKQLLFLLFLASKYVS